MPRTFTDDICDKCGNLTIDGADPAWYYGTNHKLNMTFIEHDCEGEL